MKRRFAWLLAVLLMLALLCACAETKTASTEPYTVGSYTVTPINEKSGTITDGTNTYSYRYSTSGSGYSVTFSYPDGESYTPTLAIIPRASSAPCASCSANNRWKGCTTI